MQMKERTMTLNSFKILMTMKKNNSYYFKMYLISLEKSKR